MIGLTWKLAACFAIGMCSYFLFLDPYLGGSKSTRTGLGAEQIRAELLSGQISYTPYLDKGRAYLPKDLDYDLPIEQRDPSSEFLLSGKNSEATIRNLKSLNGISIQELEDQMRPGAAGPKGSIAGFLGHDESLIEILATDNHFVVAQSGLTHQSLSKPLVLFEKFYRKFGSGTLWIGEIEIRCGMFTGSGGYQFSPFDDGTKTDLKLEIFNPMTKQKIGFSTLVPEMIYRYGFYEGHGTSYRVPPEKIVAFFGLEQ